MKKKSLVRLVKLFTTIFVLFYSFSPAVYAIDSLSSGLSVVYINENVVVSGDGTFTNPMKTLPEGLSAVTSGGTISLLSDIHTTTEFNINTPVMIDGDNHTLFSNFTKTDNSNNSGIGIHSNSVTIKNLTIDGTSGTKLHGINIYMVNNILLENVTSSNNDSAGIVVNGSIVTVTNIKTSGNGWGGINVDLGVGVNTQARLTVNKVSSHTESNAIWIDDITKGDISVIDVNHQYVYTDFGNTRIYSLDNITPVITNINVDKTYVKTGDIVTITADVTDTNGVLAVSSDFSNNENFSQSPTPSYVNMSLVSGNTYKVMFTIPSNWTDGPIFVKVAARDLTGGNWVRSTEYKVFTVDNTSPTKPQMLGFEDPILSCGAYTQMGIVTIDWSDSRDSGSGLKGYDYSINYPRISGGRSTYNAFFTTSSYRGTLNEGLHQIKVRAVDNAGNTSEWTDLCDITHDTIAPTTPALVSPANNIYMRGDSVTNIWTDTSTDISYYIYESYNNASLTSLRWRETSTRTSKTATKVANASFWWRVQAVDLAGNKSEWSEPWKITIDNSSPLLDIIFPMPDPSAKGFQVKFNEDVNKTDAENAANYFLNNWPGAGGSGDLLGDATIVYDSNSKTATVSFLNNGWYISPEQQWGVQNIHDLAGNLQNENPYTEYSTARVAPVTTISNIDSLWYNNDVAVNLTCTDINGSGCEKTYYSLNNGPYVLGNSVAISTDGENILSFYSVDKVGKIENPQLSNVIKIDKTNPFLEILTPGIDLLKSGQFTISGNTSDNLSGINRLILDFGNGQTYAINPSTPNWAFDINDGTIDIADGSYNVNVIVEDNATNQTQATINNLVIDNTIPTGQILGLNTFTVGQAPSTILKLEDNNNLNKVCYSTNGTTYDCNSISGTNYDWNITGILNLLGTGNFEFSYYIVDEAENQSDSDTLTIQRDPYTTIGTIQAVVIPQAPQGQVAGVSTVRNTPTTTSVDSVVAQEVVTETSDTPTITPTDTTPQVLGTEDTSTTTNDPKGLAWWVYAIGGTTIILVLLAIIRRQRKEDSFN